MTTTVTSASTIAGRSQGGATRNVPALTQVNARCERAAMAWEEMAERLERTSKLRSEREDAAARAAEQRQLMAAE